MICASRPRPCRGRSTRRPRKKAGAPRDPRLRRAPCAGRHPAWHTARATWSKRVPARKATGDPDVVRRPRDDGEKAISHAVPGNVRVSTAGVGPAGWPGRERCGAATPNRTLGSSHEIHRHPDVGGPLLATLSFSVTRPSRNAVAGRAPPRSSGARAPQGALRSAIVSSTIRPAVAPTAPRFHARPISRVAATSGQPRAVYSNQDVASTDRHAVSTLHAVSTRASARRLAGARPAVSTEQRACRLSIPVALRIARRLRGAASLLPSATMRSGRTSALDSTVGRLSGRARPGSLLRAIPYPAYPAIRTRTRRRPSVACTHPPPAYGYPVARPEPAYPPVS